MGEVQTESIVWKQNGGELFLGLYWGTPIFSNEYDPNLE